MVKRDDWDAEPGGDAPTESSPLDSAPGDHLDPDSAPLGAKTAVAEFDARSSNEARDTEAAAFALRGRTSMADESDTAAAGDVTPIDANAEAVDSEDGKAEKRFTLHALGELLHDLLIAVVVCVFLIAYVVQAFKVQGSSMSPSLINGERILVNKFVYSLREIERGDVVVFWYPEDPDLSFIKRIVGLPGEIVEIRNGEVFVDGEAQVEEFVHSTNKDARNMTPREVRPGHYFVLGDNRSGSNDSRSWGYVPKRYIYGKAFVRLWPVGSVGFVR